MCGMQMRDAARDGGAGPSTSGSLLSTAKLTNSSRYADVMGKVGSSSAHRQTALHGTTQLGSLTTLRLHHAQIDSGVCITPRCKLRWRRARATGSPPPGRAPPNRTPPTSALFVPFRERTS